MALTADSLRQLGQDHLLEGRDASQVASMLAELNGFADQYPGGVEAYVSKARALFAREHSTGEGANDGPEHREPEVPTNVVSIPSYDTQDPAERELILSRERTGNLFLKSTAFVLVAGGLGERLGFSGIKLALPVETAAPESSYLRHYLTWISAAAGPDAPVVLMTSVDTDAKTRAFLDANANFGHRNVTLLKQEAVLCLADSSARLATDPKAEPPHGLLRKPHGHGDVHVLLHQSGLHKVWQELGVTHVAFFQDTNAQNTLTIPQSLAVCSELGLTMSFTCVPRLPGEAVGALVSVKCRDNIRRTINIEYNVIDRLLKQQQPESGGDRPASETNRFSPFPGSINTLLVAFPRYFEVLEASKGVVPEFVNPKYADASKTTFKAPTRLECLMQDIALMFNENDKVGACVFDRRLYSPVKNALADGIAKTKQSLDAHCATTGEASQYLTNRMLLRCAGVTIPEPLSTAVVAEPGSLTTLPPVNAAPIFPIVSFGNFFASSVSQLKQRFPNPDKVKLSERSVLVIDDRAGGDIVIESLDLDGALEIRGQANHTLRVADVEAKNKGWSLHAVNPESPKASEVLRMRGFRLGKDEQETM